MTCFFIPPYLLRRLATVVPEAADTLSRDAGFRHQRESTIDTEHQTALPGRPADQGDWTVFDAGNAEILPGRQVRAAGEPATGDLTVNEAADGIAASLQLFAEHFGRDSFDARGATCLVTVHYGEKYDNAFWNGSQLVFGDGDGEVFERFTKSVDVLGHEFGHAVTEHTCGLEYQDQPGALNESLSDVYASCLKQELLGQTADQADWLIGEGLFVSGVKARALRDLAAPGTAYDDPRLGNDPQVGHLRDYIDTANDNGGVHLNSGIPNRAFYLAATAIGGRSIAGAGRIWYAAATSDAVGPRTSFLQFAQATVAAAGEHEAAVIEAWRGVGVEVEAKRDTPAESAISASEPIPPTPRPGDVSKGPGSGDTVVKVVRSGGFAGRRVEAEVDLASGDDLAFAVGDVVPRLALEPVDELPQPDRFVYTFEICGQGPVTVPEQRLNRPQRELVQLLFDRLV